MDVEFPCFCYQVVINDVHWDSDTIEHSTRTENIILFESISVDGKKKK